MAFNPDNVKFILSQIENVDYRTYRSNISQLFNYLNDEVKDNPVFNFYQQEVLKWSSWPNNNQPRKSSGDWILPKNLDEAKSLAFTIYDKISKNDDDGSESFIRNLIDESMLPEVFVKFNNIFFGYLKLTIDDIIKANPETDKDFPKKIKSNTVFIVHGHDNELRLDVQLLLSKAGVNSIVLHEQVDRGRTIIDKLIEETEVAGYALALLTPDDLTDLGDNRARQNVILEIGYFLGILGKERIRLVVKDNIEIPSDLHGILYQKYDSGGAWKIKILKELQAVGIYVDILAAIDEF